MEPNVVVLHFSSDNKVSGPCSTAVHVHTHTHVHVHVQGPSG